MKFTITFELGKYYLNTEDNQKYELYLWTEGDKTYKDGSPKIHLRHKRFHEITGREYIAKRLVDQSLHTNGKYEFEFKPEEDHRTGLGWSEYMTEEEKTEYYQALKTIETIKKTCIERQKTPLTEADKLQRQIEKLMAQRQRLLDSEESN